MSQHYYTLIINVALLTIAGIALIAILFYRSHARRRIRMMKNAMNIIAAIKTIDDTTKLYKANDIRNDIHKFYRIYLKQVGYAEAIYHYNYLNTFLEQRIDVINGIAKLRALQEESKNKRTF